MYGTKFVHKTQLSAYVHHYKKKAEKVQLGCMSLMERHVSKHNIPENMIMNFLK